MRRWMVLHETLKQAATNDDKLMIKSSPSHLILNGIFKKKSFLRIIDIWYDSIKAWDSKSCRVKHSSVSGITFLLAKVTTQYIGLTRLKYEYDITTLPVNLITDRKDPIKLHNYRQIWFSHKQIIELPPFHFPNFTRLFQGTPIALTLLHL